MICPRCGAYNSNNADQCAACDAPFNRDERRAGTALEDDTGLTNDLHGRWIWWWPAEYLVVIGIIDLVVGTGVGVLLLSYGFVAAGLVFLAMAVSGVIVALYALSGE